MRTLLKILVATGLVSALLAQGDAPRPFVFNWQTADFVSGQLISGPPVKGAPYSAEAVNETIQTLADGNRIVQHSSAMQYRDSEGRERREETSAMGAIFITDPVAGARYTLHPESKTAEKGPGAVFNITTYAAGVRGGRSGGVNVAISGPGSGIPATNQFFFVTAGRIDTWSGDAKIEQLGNMFIEGVQAQGTRTTTTIPAGQIGNDKPINIVDERWYSPDLQMTIMTRHSDPRTGETSFALKNINRSSPPPNLFEVPADYTVKTGPMGQAIHIERRE